MIAILYKMTNRVISVDPNTVQSVTNLLRITEGPSTEPMLTEDDNAGVLLNDENDTYH